MNILWWILIGGLAGFLAKAIMPGSKHEPKGCLLTIGLGIAGSLLFGFLGSLFGGSGGPAGFVGATLGAMLIIFVARKAWA
jgi:uncharacterized membrane protein YeaQ/YmgE (transglycosylase-associated protein family)